MNRIPVSACVMVLVFARAAFATDPPGMTQANAANAIAIDLNSDSQVGHLNFDVPITLQLTLDNDVMSVQVFESDSATKVVCDNTLKFVSSNTWRRFTLGRAPAVQQAGDTKTTAFVTVDAVDANHYVCFKFRVEPALSSDEVTKFTNDAIAAIDSALRQIDTRTLAQYTDPQIEFIRQELRRVIGVWVGTSLRDPFSIRMSTWR